MPNIAALLKQEIVRQVRKELRAETLTLKKSLVQHRTEIRDLKQRLAVLERQPSRTSASQPRATPLPTQDGASPKFRFRPAGLKKMREQFELTAAVLASILQVSTQTVYNWEAGSSRPSQEQLTKFAILKKMGKRKVQATLKQQSDH
ncbi:helix-turn-helix domain-containing protein [Denitratisoma sp. DHT3]|uniref:helix-turn-helix domain-containing protein n=1 Tax=Denitratisoma sp. DHT3 TaxID=1981880 RepID=UPI001648D952|nr:helix-turn-helix domain-containing protein [Denitratisoma sp. DHT3]